MSPFAGALFVRGLIRKTLGVFARMRSFAYNILRINQSDTIAQDRYAAALGGLKFI